MAEAAVELAAAQGRALVLAQAVVAALVQVPAGQERVVAQVARGAVRVEVVVRAVGAPGAGEEASR